MAGQPDRRPVLVLVRTLVQPYREYLLASLAPRYRIWLLQDEEPGWARPYLADWAVLDPLNPAALLAAARGLDAAGVLCWDETTLEAAAGLARALGLPGADPAAVRRCRDKHLTRRALDTAGVPQARSAAVATAAQARAAADRIGYPVVVKPRALSGSYGVVRVDGPGELAAAVRHARAASMPGVPAEAAPVLVEEHLDGPEVSVDSAVVDGQVTPLAVARKELGYPPYFEEVGHLVDAADPLLGSPRLRAVLQAAHDAVDFRTGWTHVEFRLVGGEPRLVEINARLGGDLIPYLGWQATGIDPGLVAAAVATGQPPRPAPTRSRAAGVRFLYPAGEVVVGAVRVGAALPAAVDRAVALAAPGQRIAPPPAGHVFGRYGYVTAVADTVAECRAALDAAAAAVRLEPAAVGTPR
ncbi:MAG TPA: ATP-grasp domain-containing protein [Mycobacteriales bacterium]|nr:ATP-grasp domain-containing protein [Mycobacteriales bacterium]